MAPQRPINKPASWLLLTLFLNKKTAIIKVKIGTSAFNIPTSELSSCVCALVNRKAGIPFPNKPTMIMGRMWCFCILNIFFQTNGKRLSQAMLILSCATSRSLKTISPFFIRINELPQMKARRISKSQVKTFLLENDTNNNFCEDMLVFL